MYEKVFKFYAELPCEFVDLWFVILEFESVGEGLSYVFREIDRGVYV